LKESLYAIRCNTLAMAEPKDGRPIFFPKKLVLLGNLALFVWIVLDAVLKTESILAQNNLLNKVKQIQSG